MIAMQLSIQLQYLTCRCDSPSLERKYSEHGSYRGAQRRTFEVGLCLSVDAGERLVRRTVARRTERSRSDFVCPGMSGETGAENRGAQGTVLAHFNVAQKWRETSSNGPTNSAAE